MNHFDLALAGYLANLQAASPLAGYVLGCDVGQRFVRIHKADGVSRSVVCFVERSTGYILGAKSWKCAGRATASTIYQAARFAA